MKKVGRIILLSILCICIFNCLTSCGGKAEYSCVSSRKAFEDGWVYTFSYQYGSGDGVDDIIPYSFTVINMRHRYGDGYDEPIQIYGEGSDPAVDRDMRKISSLLGYGGNAPTKDELLATNADSIEFEVVDKDAFFEVMRGALCGEARDVGEYPNLPSYALLSEQMFIDGYAFQIGLLANWGYADYVYIDVLYEDADAPHGYVQLSDMADGGDVSQEQSKLFSTLGSIASGIVSGNDLSYGKDENCDSVIADVKLSRLYDMLDDIEAGKIGAYSARGKE